MAKQYVLGLPPGMLGLPFDTQILGGGGVWNTANTMAGSVAEPALHPLIRDWYNGADAATAISLNVDPYRKAMSLNYAYATLDGSPAEYIVNCFANELVDGATRQTPFNYTDGDSTTSPPSWGSLADPLVAPRGWGFFEGMQVRFNTAGWNRPINTAASVISTEYYDLLSQENMGEYNEGIPYLDQYLLGEAAQDPGTGSLSPGPLNPRLVDAGQVGSYDGLFAHTVTAPVYYTSDAHHPRVLFDHSFGYLNANEYNIDDPLIPDSVALSVTAEYNFFVDSSPDYEDVILPDRIPECLLPNYYMMETQLLYSHLTDGHLDFLQGDPYLSQVSLGTRNSSFTDLFSHLAAATTITDPLISEGYWHLYSMVLAGNHPTIGTITDADLNSYERRFKNIVIPHESLDFISAFNENSSLSGDPANPGPTGPFTALSSSYPFFTQIIIDTPSVIADSDGDLGLEQHAGGNPPDTPGIEVDFLTGFIDGTIGASSGLTAQQRSYFVKMLQLIVANSYNPDLDLDPASGLSGIVNQSYYAGGPGRYNINLDLNYMGEGDGSFSEVDQNPQPIVETLGKNQPIKVCAEVDKLLVWPPTQDMTLMNHPYWQAYYHLTSPAASDTTNYSVLRPTFTIGDPTGMTLNDWLFENPSNTGTDLSAIWHMFQGYTRNLNSIYKGQLANVSPLLYLIEKRRIPEGETSAPLTDEPVQRIFITPRWTPVTGMGSPIIYNDTQIKMAPIRYQYNFRVINLVFGTQYMYVDVSTYFPHGWDDETTLPVESMGRALANALGFYREENPLVSSLGDYLNGGIASYEEAQHNSLRLSNEFDLTSGPTAGMAKPSMYFLDSGPLGWPAVPYQTDIGADGGWHGGTAGGDEGDRTVVLAHSGFYVFGGPVGTSDFSYDWVQDYTTWLADAPLAPITTKAQVADEYGAPGAEINAPTPGGFYEPTMRDNILGRMFVRVIEGMGHDGNDTGGLVPASVSVPEWEGPIEINIPDEEMSVCDWVKQFHPCIREAFMDWYTEEYTFRNMMDSQPFGPWLTLGPWVGLSLEFQMIGAPAGPNWTTEPDATDAQRQSERWWHGDCWFLTDMSLPLYPFTNVLSNQSNYLVLGYGSLVDTPLGYGYGAGRFYASWYCPNWGTQNGTHFAAGEPNIHAGAWRCHSYEQIVYWLWDWTNARDLFSTDFGQYVENTPNWRSDGYINRAYLSPNMHMGIRGPAVLEAFGSWWNNNYSSYSTPSLGGEGNISSKSPIGVTKSATQTDYQAWSANDGADWSDAEFMAMIPILYDPNCGNWQTPDQYAGMVPGAVAGSGDQPGGQSGTLSDIRLKENIKKVEVSPSGLNIYEFNYIGSPDRYRGVMAQEVLEAKPLAVAIDPETGMYSVYYDLIDVDFVKLTNVSTRKSHPTGRTTL